MCQYANWLRDVYSPHGNWHIDILAHYLIGILLLISL